MPKKEDLSTPEGRDKYVRRTFGGLAIAIIKATANRKALDTLIEFIRDIQKK